jgi:hypothetical protein
MMPKSHPPYSAEFRAEAVVWCAAVARARQRSRRSSASRWKRCGRGCATLECELLARQTFSTYLGARTTLFDCTDVFYNRLRRHSALGYLSPERFERNLLETPVVA